jgi:hypothetical protein
MVFPGTSQPEICKRFLTSKKYSEKYPGPSGDLSAVFKSSLATDFLDSVVTSGGKLKTAKREGNIASFEFEFHKDAPLKSLVLKFNEFQRFTGIYLYEYII